MFGPCTLAVACFTLKVDLRDLGHLDGSPVESKDCRRLDDHSVLQSAGECGPPRNLKVKIIFQTIKIFQKKFEHFFFTLVFVKCHSLCQSSFRCTFVLSGFNIVDRCWKSSHKVLILYLADIFFAA